MISQSQRPCCPTHLHWGLGHQNTDLKGRDGSSLTLCPDLSYELTGEGMGYLLLGPTVYPGSIPSLSTRVLLHLHSSCSELHTFFL